MQHKRWRHIPDAELQPSSLSVCILPSASVCKAHTARHIQGCHLALPWRAGQYTPAPYERVHAVHTWLQAYIMERQTEGGMAVPPPILTRLQAFLSDAMLAYEQARCAGAFVLLLRVCLFSPHVQPFT